MIAQEGLIARGERAEVIAPPLRQRQTLLAMGGVCAIAGTLVLAVSLASHGDLPTHVSTEAAMRVIAGHSNWYLMHLGTIVGGLLWVGAFAMLAATLSQGVAGALGRLLLPSAIIGGLFVVFDYSLDGYAFKALADAWAVAPGPEQAELLRTLDVLLALGSGTFRAELLLFYGLTVCLAGLAVAFDGGYPVWFGAIGAAAGAVVVAAGLLALAGVALRVDALVFAVILPIEGVWMLALGTMLWRRAGRVRGLSHSDNWR